MTEIQPLCLRAARLACAGLVVLSFAGRAEPEDGGASYAPFGEMLRTLPEAVPDDPAAHTRAGRYATRLQAQHFAAANEQRVLWLQTECCAPGALDQAAREAHDRRAALQLAREAPVFVLADDLPHGARVADHLEAAGHAVVFLVTR